MKRLSSYIHYSDNSLEKILDKASAIKKIEQEIQNFSPKELFHDIKVTNLNNGKLILATESAGKQMKLRYQTNELLSTLRRLGHHSLSGVIIKVQPLTHSDFSLQKPKIKTFSKTAVHTIRNLLTKLREPHE